jgi:hypothetical protein
MSERYKGRSKPPRRRADERTDVIDAIVQAVTRCLVDWFLWWISKGGHL